MNATQVASWAKQEWSDPVRRGGYSLVANSGFTAALGFAYWLVAARLYDDHAVGVGSALISTMMLVATVAQIGLRQTLVRFVPVAGRGVRLLIARSYALSGGLALLGGAAVLAALGPRVDDLHDAFTPLGFVAFSAGCALWVVFNLQDSVLTGLGKAPWIPVENVVFGIAKLGLLVALAAVGTGLGVFASWVAPLLAIVIPVNIIMSRRAIPEPSGEPQTPIAARELTRFAGIEFATSLVWQGLVFLLPPLVLAFAGAEASAHYYVSWSVAYTLYLIGSNIGQAMLAASAKTGEPSIRVTRSALRLIVGLTLPGAAVLALAAPYVLAAFGAEYQTGATTTLRLLALSAVPYSFTSLYVAVCRARQEVGVVFAIYATLAVAVLATTAVLAPVIGVVSIGWAWLAGQTVVCAGVLVHGMWKVWIHQLPPATVSALVSLKGSLSAARSKSASPVPEADLRARFGRALLSTDVISDRPEMPVVRALVAHHGSEPREFVVKCPRSPEAQADVRSHRETVLSLRAHHPALRPLLPSVAATSSAEGPVPAAPGRSGSHLHVETALPGVPAAEMLDAGVDPAQVRHTVFKAAAHLHALTGFVTSVGSAQLEGWLHRPADVIRGARLRPAAEAALEQVVGGLSGRLANRSVRVCRIHGDLTPDNVLVSPGGSVTGLIDWGQSKTAWLPEIDFVHYRFAEEVRKNRELGDVVVELLADPGVFGEIPGGNGLNPADVVILGWLAHVSQNLEKARAYESNPLWLARNVEAVLDALADHAPAAGAPGPAAEPPPSPHRSPSSDDACDAPEPGRSLSPTHVPGAGTAWVPAGAVLVWLASLPFVDPRAMTDLGLLSVLPWTVLAALGVVVASFVFGVATDRRSPASLHAHLVALALIVHATPALLYSTPRYSWAYKHLGIVDFIGRHGGVDLRAEQLDVYHNWPGFFGGTALLEQLVGARHLELIAVWAPVAFSILGLGLLRMLFSAFTNDTRVVWLATLLAFFANWVGQEYFAPQALAWLAHMAVLALVATLLKGRRAPSGVSGLIGRRGTAPLAALLALLLFAIVASHQLTPLLTIGSLVVLASTRRARVGWTLGALVVLFAGWIGLVARQLVIDNIRSRAEDVGSPLSNTGSNLIDVATASDGHYLVAMVGRGLTLAVIALAALGLARRLANRRIDAAPALMAAMPVALPLVSSYDGEIIFRVVLFSAPWAALLAAYLLFPTKHHVPRPGTVAAWSALACMLLASFLFAHHGKERQNYFTRGEVDAATWLYDTAEPGALIIEGNRNYPNRLVNYDAFVHVPIAREPADSRARVVADPVAAMHRWMTDADHRGFVLLTRSMRIKEEALPTLPRGFLADMETQMRNSSLFRVIFENDDAVVFAPAETVG